MIASETSLLHKRKADPREEAGLCCDCEVRQAGRRAKMPKAAMMA